MSLARSNSIKHADAQLAKMQGMTGTAMATSAFLFVVSIVIAGLLIGYSMTYGSKWGNHGKNCDDRFPMFMLVTGIVQCALFGFFLVIILAAGLSTTPEGSTTNHLGHAMFMCVMPLACIACPAACFLFPWAISTWVFFFTSESTCGPEMYKIWWVSFVASTSLNCVAQCCKPKPAATPTAAVTVNELA